MYTEVRCYRDTRTLMLGLTYWDTVIVGVAAVVMTPVA